MLSIQTNVNALTAAMNVNTTERKLGTTINQLSSGYRINSPADDAAGLGISEALQADIASYQQASQNAVDGQSVVQTASSAMTEVTNILTRMRTLGMEAANSDVNLSSSAQGDVTTEFKSLVSELDRINGDTEYNSGALFGSGVYTFQVGVGSSATNDVVSVDLSNVKVDSATLKVTGLKLDNSTDAQAALTAIDAAIATVSTNQATVGAADEQLGSAINTIAAASQSLSAANAGLRNVDVASASAQLSQQQVLAQAGIAVLAQANQMPSQALKLLG